MADFGITEAIAIAGLASSAASTGIGAIGAQKSAAAQRDEASYQAQVAENNRIVAEQNARYSAQASRTNAQNQDLRTKALLGTTMAAQGASGLDVMGPSSVDVRESTRQIGRLQTLEEIQKGGLDIYGYQAKAAGFGAEAELERRRASSASSAGRLNTFGTLIGGASSLSDKWLRYKNVGVFGGGGLTGRQGPGDFPGELPY